MLPFGSKTRELNFVRYESASDIRRGLTQRLINTGVSAETLKVVMRHKDFATTEKHYGAMRAAQNAGAEIIARLRPATENIAFVGGNEKSPTAISRGAFGAKVFACKALSECTRMGSNH